MTDQFVSLSANICTCGLHTDTIHRPIAVSGLPCSILIHVYARSASAWFTTGPFDNAHVPAINISEVTTSLKARMTTFRKKHTPSC